MAKLEQISKTQKKLITDWIDKTKKVGHPTICQHCSSNDWVLGDHFVTPLILLGDDLTLRGECYPVAMLICSKCGLTLYFNTVIMGIPTTSKEEVARV